MTKSQFKKKIEVAQKTGRAYLGENTLLYFFGDYWSLREAKSGQTIATCTHSPEKHFDFMVD